MNGGTIPSGYIDKYNATSDTISISEGGNSCGYVQYNKQPFWSGGHCYTLSECRDSVNYKYLYYYLKFKELSIMKLRIGSGLPNIQKKDLGCFPILDIDIETQCRYAQILDDLSTKINTEFKLKAKYGEQKKYLLSNMFI